jgi:hypothetical protein
MNDSSSFDAALTQADVINTGKESNTTTAVILIDEQYIVLFIGPLNELNTQLSIHTQAFLYLLQDVLNERSIVEIELDYVREGVRYFFARPDRSNSRSFFFSNRGTLSQANR